MCFIKRKVVVVRVRLDSWSLSGLVGGFLQTFSLGTRGGGFRKQLDNGLESELTPSDFVALQHPDCKYDQVC